MSNDNELSAISPEVAEAVSTARYPSDAEVLKRVARQQEDDRLYEIYGSTCDEYENGQRAERARMRLMPPLGRAA